MPAPGGGHRVADLAISGRDERAEERTGDSEVTFDREGERDSTLWQAALGLIWRVPNGYHLTFALRGQERGLCVGEDNAPVWASVAIGRGF